MNVQHGFRSKGNELNLSEDRPLQIENENDLNIMVGHDTYSLYI